MAAALRPRILLLYALLAAVLLVAVSYQLQVTRSRYEELTRGEALADLPIDVDAPAFAVVEGEDADAAAATPGDRLTRIGGRVIRGLDDLYQPILQSRPGDRLAFEFQPPAGSGRARYT